MRAYAIAVQPPAGPVFLSIPLDDWDKPALGPAVVRTVSHRVSPDTQRLGGFAERINRAQRPVLVYGPEIDRSGAWDAGVAFAEKLGAPVYTAPLPDRASFPEDHRLYQGPLPMTIAGATDVLRGHDLAIVIGAQVFRYYPYVAGDYLPEGTPICCKSPTIRPWPRRHRWATARSATHCWRWSTSWAWSMTTATETCPPRRSIPLQSTCRRPRRWSRMRCGRPWLR
jgi:thiamine pyrophosphate-dependent acetolactate synthase large subunit-like protein